MPTSASARRTCLANPVPEEVISAAGAVFGVLELIAETGGSPDTVENARIALRGADARLRELGLAREDLLGLGEGDIFNDCPRPLHEHHSDGPQPPNVILLRPSVARSSREPYDRRGLDCGGHLESC
jgi:hypothetical protein